MHNLNDNHPITVVEFCAGYGGLGLGIKRVLADRMQLVGLCELEGFAQANLVSKMETGLMAQVPIWSNLLTFPYRKFRGLVDIAVAGIPCQPHSHAGKHKGGADERFLFDLSRCNQEPSSSRTSKGYFRVECQTELFASPGRLRDWKQWVIGLRQAYSQRVNAVRVTNAGEYSSLPTPCANEDSFRLNGSSQQSKTLEARARRGELMTTGSVQPVERVSLRGAGVTMLNLNVLPALSGHIHLFTNPQLMDALNVAKTFRPGLTTPSGPLSPSFVEVMMGLPVGWTDSASSATELSQQPPL